MLKSVVKREIKSLASQNTITGSRSVNVKSFVMKSGRAADSSMVTDITGLTSLTEEEPPKKKFKASHGDDDSKKKM
jgi:hypothetical protein